jgi:hypothetical protein
VRRRDPFEIAPPISQSRRYESGVDVHAMTLSDVPTLSPATSMSGAVIDVSILGPP